MADIINQSSENMNNLSEEEYKTTTDKPSLCMQAGIIASARSVNKGEETQVNEFEELILMKNLLKRYKGSKEFLRKFAALGKEYLEGLHCSERYSRILYAIITAYMGEMEDNEKEAFLAFFGGGSLFEDLLNTTIIHYPYLRQSN